jgi:hypothetical protein
MIGLLIRAARKRPLCLCGEKLKMEIADLQTKYEEIKEKVTQLGRFL